MNLSLVPVWQRDLAPGPVHALWAVNLDGRLVVPLAEPAGLRLYDPARPDGSVYLPGPPEEVEALCPLPGPRIATARADGYVRVWGLASGSPVASFETKATEVICPVPYGGRHLLGVAGEDSVVSLWDPDTGERVTSIAETSMQTTLMCLVRSYGRDLLVTANGDQDYVLVWDIVKDQEWAHLTDHVGAPAALGAVPLTDDPDGDQLLATSDWTNALATWDPTTGERVATMDGLSDVSIALFALHAGDRHLLGTGGGDERLRVWDPNTGEQICEFEAADVVQDAVQAGGYIVYQMPDRVAACRLEVQA